MHTSLVKSGLFSFRDIIALTLLAALTGCAIPGRPDPALSERLEQNGYSFIPPDEAGWFIAERSSNRVTLARLGKVEGQTYLIEGAHLALDKLASASRLAEFVEDLHRRDLPMPRFRIREYEISEIRIAGAQCVLSHIVAEDRDPETGTNVVTAMLVESAGTVCIQPTMAELGITLNVSHRSFPEDRDRAFKAYADNLLQTQQFSSVVPQPEN